jgi:hypothetical protein
MLPISFYTVLYAQRVLKMLYQFLRIFLVHMLPISIYIVLAAPFGYRPHSTVHAPHAILFIPFVSVSMHLALMKGMRRRINSHVACSIVHVRRALGRRSQSFQKGHVAALESPRKEQTVSTG